MFVPAINMLKNKQPGTFVVRDSNSFPGAFGLALKVSQVPPNVQTKGGECVMGFQYSVELLWPQTKIKIIQLFSFSTFVVSRYYLICDVLI